MDLISKPEMADNAENAVKCSVCGNSILVGSEDGHDRQSAVCDVCRSRQALRPDRVTGVSNEDY